jgi:acetyl esterase/lipase
MVLRQMPYRHAMRALFKLLLLLPTLAASGCSGADLVNALAPDTGFRHIEDIAYGDETRQRLDLYIPASAAPPPVVVFFYGGNWQSGDKETYRFVGAALAARGFAVVVPDYRVYPEVRYPGFIEDGAAAVRWTLAHIARYGGDPARVSLMGHSAGAYIAMMLALDPEWLGADRARIRGVVGLAGPYDFLPLTDPTLKLIFATAPEIAQTQPIQYADATAPPALLAAGRLDRTVLPANSTRLAARLRAAAVPVETQYYTILDHITLIGALGEPLCLVTPVLGDVTRFLAAEAPAVH